HNSWFNGTTLTSSVFLNFDFYVPVVIDEAQWFQSSATAQGTWQWQGSTDCSSYSNIGSPQAYTATANFVFTSLHGNVTAYRCYRMQGSSGSTSSSPFQSEIEFKVNQPFPTAGNLNFTGDPRCFGNRTGSITITQSTALFNTTTCGALSTMVDGNPWITAGPPG